MASFFSIIHIILLSVFCSTTTESQPTLRDHEIQRTSQKSVRARRSLTKTMPFQLRVKIKYQQEEEINLVWTRRDLTLANEYLPIISPFAYSNDDVMNDVGEFVMYYDTKQSSAVVYFKKSNAFYGVIGVDYYIDSLPFDFNDEGEHRLGVITDLYIRKNREPLAHIDPILDPPPPSDIEAWNNYIQTSDTNPNQSRKRPSNCVLDTKAKQSRTERHIRGIIEATVNINEHKNGTSRRRRVATSKQEYFLETLVFVTRDIVELFERTFGADHYIEWIVRHLIVYFSAVDMIFQRLRITKVQMFINLAKIVIEDDLTPFNFIRNDELQFKYITVKLPQFLYDQQLYFKPDSFDHVFVYTRRPIMDGFVQVDGLTKYDMDLYEARKLNQFYTAVPITAVKFKNFFADYVTTVHEIGRIVRLKIESREKGLTTKGQCYGIMQRSGPKCDKCLNWSADSQKQFEMFFTENRNRCFLLNEPRSLRPPGPSKFLTPYRQCECFGYNSYIAHTNGVAKYSVNRSGCDKPLRCTLADGDQSHGIPTVRPFDGTTCGHRNEVCWNGKCVPDLTKQLKNQQCQI